MAMNVLDRASRDSVVFDPANEQHRRWVNQGLASKSWGQCPVKFKVQGLIDMETAIKRDLLDYYLTKEFG